MLIPLAMEMLGKATVKLYVWYVTVPKMFVDEATTMLPPGLSEFPYKTMPYTLFEEKLVNWYWNGRKVTGAP